MGVVVWSVPMADEDELHELCNDGDVDGLRSFIRNCKAGYDFNQYENWKWRYTPLGIACKKGHLGIVKVLLSHPDVNIEQGWVGEWGLVRTPLEIASSVGEDEIVKCLIEKKCNVTAKAFLNYTKNAIKQKKMNKLAAPTPEEESQHRRAEEQKQHQMKQEIREKEEEIERIKKDNKRLTRENTRMKSEVNLLNDQ